MLQHTICIKISRSPLLIKAQLKCIPQYLEINVNLDICHFFHFIL